MWRIMKLIIVIMTAFLMQVSASSRAQLITIKERNATLKRVFSEIKRQTGYVFLYKSEDLEKTKPINLNLNNVKIDDALRVILQNQGLEYAIEDKSVVVSKKEEPSFLENIIRNVMAIDVRGRVTDENGQGLAGATVIVVGGGSTKTDQNGDFYLQGVDEKAVIRISYVGYKDVEMKAKKEVNVQMEQVSSDLQEVVVNKGYYTTSQKLNTGSVSTVNAVDIAKSPVSNVLSAVQGRVTGAFISQNTGVPGGDFTVQIRGVNSIANGSKPLYVVNGIPYPDNSSVGGVNSNLRGGNPLNFISPSDISSISILKDADATAIYGSRGANGVVLITTKKGGSGKTKVDLSTYAGWGQVTRKIDLMNTQEYLEMRREAFKNDNTAPKSYDYDVNGTWDQNRYTDWQKVFWGNTAHYNDARISVSGGNENTQYLVGGGYHSETTVFPGDGNDGNASMHFNINSASANKKFTIAISGEYLADVNKVSPVGNVASTILLQPNAPALYNADGSLNWAPITSGQPGTWANPMANYLYYQYRGRNNNLTGNALFGYSIIPGLQLKVNAGYSNMQSKEVAALPHTMSDPGYGDTPAQSTSQFSNGSVRSWIIEPQLNFSKTLSWGKIEGLFGTTFQQKNSEMEVLNAAGFTSNAFITNPGAASKVTAGPNSYAQYTYEAIFGRINYNLQDKYILNLTARRDGSSRFGPESRFANFYAIGLGWIFSEEAFIKSAFPFVSSGKIRGSYGSTGSDQLPDYYYMDLYSNSSLKYDGITYLNPTRLFNPSLAWELTKKLEGGIELGLLKDRIKLEANFYRNRTGNQLLQLPLSPVTGFGSITTNLPGVVQNTGVELSLNTENIRQKDFIWHSSFNITLPKNKLVSYPNLSSVSTNFAVGEPLQSTRVYRFEGVDQATGLYLFSDGKGGTTSSPNFDLNSTYMVSTLPKLYGGFQNHVEYKQFSLDFLFQYVKQKGLTYDGTIFLFPGLSYNMPTDYLNRWKSGGDIATYQKYSQTFTSVYSTFSVAKQSDFVYTDASFIRLKNVEFSWSVPTSLSKRLAIDKLRLYTQGQNLLTWTPYKRGLDPESQGVNLPPLRVFTFGIQATF